jgi:hypothetical protein
MALMAPDEADLEQIRATDQKTTKYYYSHSRSEDRLKGMLRRQTPPSTAVLNGTSHKVQTREKLRA